MDRVHRPQQHPGQLALLDPVLPRVRREHDVHVPDQRPDDVVRRELPGRDAADGPAVGVRRPTTRPPGRRPARRPSRACRRSWPSGTGTGSARRPSSPRVEPEAVPMVTGRAAHSAPRAVSGRTSPQPCDAHSPGAHRRAPAAKTCSITSSTGGSSMVRSVTPCSDSSRPATAAERSLSTRSVIRSPSTRHHLAVRGERGRVDRPDRGRDRLALGVAGGQRPQRAVVEDRAVVDHDHALAQRLHVGHVVAGQQHGRAAAGVVLGQERPDPLLHGHVEPDGRLVQEQHLRASAAARRRSPPSSARPARAGGPACGPGRRSPAARPARPGSGGSPRPGSGRSPGSSRTSPGRAGPTAAGCGCP